MALTQSNYAKGVLPVAYPDQAGVTVTQRFEHTIAANLALNDILELACLPAGCELVDAVLAVDDLDSNGTPLIALDVGIMSGAWGENNGSRTCGAEIFAADTTARTGGVARPSLVGAYRIAATAADRSIGVKIQAAAATDHMIGDKITLILSYVGAV